MSNLFKYVFQDTNVIYIAGFFLYQPKWEMCTRQCVEDKKMSIMTLYCNSSTLYLFIIHNVHFIKNI